MRTHIQSTFIYVNIYACFCDFIYTYVRAYACVKNVRICIFHILRIYKLSSKVYNETQKAENKAIRTDIRMVLFTLASTDTLTCIHIRTHTHTLHLCILQTKCVRYAGHRTPIDCIGAIVMIRIYRYFSLLVFWKYTFTRIYLAYN